MFERALSHEHELGGSGLESPNSESSCRRGSPCLERLASEDPVCLTGSEMALDVECVEDSGVNGQEALG